MDDEITTSEAASILGVKPRQARWYFEKGLLPGRLIAGRLVFPREAVENFEKPKRTGRPVAGEKADDSAPKKAGKSDLIESTTATPRPAAKARRRAPGKPKA